MMFVASVTLIYIRPMTYPASIIGGANVHVLCFASPISYEIGFFES